MAFSIIYLRAGSISR